MKKIPLGVLVYACAALACGPAGAQASGGDLPFRNPDLPVARRVDDLVGRMTVEEKISQLMMSCSAIPRLGIPEYDWWNEGLHGVARNGEATVFPQAIGLAATWNTNLMHRVADVIATEARAKNNKLIEQTGGSSKRYQGLTIWSPNVNIFRDPRWGRGQETYGEDPFLTGCMATAFVRGLQGDDPSYLKCVATLKHYAVHSGPEQLRHKFDAVVSPRDLHETYLPAFEMGVCSGGAMSVMSAYNAVDGVPCPASTMLLQETLRDEWGFKGAVVGDVDNVADIWKKNCHAYVEDAATASALAIKAGTDSCSGKTYEALPESLARGLVGEADLDVALRRLFALRFRLGQFDPADRVPYRSIPFSENASPAHDELALEAARQSLVLLKNDGTLPWKAGELGTVAIIGPTGNNESALLGNYNGTPRRIVTLVDGISEKFEALGAKVLTVTDMPLVRGYREQGQPFQDGVLFADAACSQPGLQGKVFDNADMKGEPASTRTDRQIDFQWDQAQPLPGIPPKKASVRWSGVLVPPASGEYLLSVEFEGKVDLYLDGKQLIGGKTKRGAQTDSTVIQLQAGKKYDLRLEYVQDKQRGHICLGWKVPGADDSLERAVAAARLADRIVLTLGLTPELEGEQMSVNAEGFDGGDRTSILLTASQRELLEKVGALHKPTVVVLTSGSAISFDEAQANAVLLCWYYGQRGADAVADALLGETNPAGRLPITFYKSDSDLPPFTDYAMANRTYRFFSGKPLYAFGHGLSYTTFDYQKLALSSVKAGPDDSVTAKVTLKNSGARAGDEVVQVYATALDSPVPMPLKTLVGFQRVPMRAGETKTVDIQVPVERLRRWNEKGNRFVVDPGNYKIVAGPASDQPLLASTLQVVGK